MLGEKSDSAVGVVVGGANRIAVARLLPILLPHMAGGCVALCCVFLVFLLSSMCRGSTFGIDCIEN